MSTNFQLNTKDGSFLVGRTMEYGIDLRVGFYIHRRRDVLDLSTLAARGFGEFNNIASPWAARYGYVGLNSFHLPGIVDGMNEQGLTVSAMWLPGTIYQKITHPLRAIPAPLLGDWVLANCATAAEVIDYLPKHEFWLPELFSRHLPLRFAISDATGHSIVVEFQEGIQHVYENLVGVCTNEPWFPEHLENLNSLSRDFHKKTLNDKKLNLSHRDNSIARFIRLAYLKQFSQQAENSKEGWILATHLLNEVDVSDHINSEGKQEAYTQCALIKDLTHQIFAVRTYDSMQYRAIELKEIDFTKIKSHSFAIPKISDISLVTPKQNVFAS